LTVRREGAGGEASIIEDKPADLTPSTGTAQRGDIAGS